MKNGKTVTLAIESSCDETAAAVLLDGREVLSNIISSQIDIHKLYGGVVPEIASRHHLTNVNTVVDQALDAAKVTMDEVDLIGVTYGPGLVGALCIGLATAKAYALAAEKPLVGVHHIQGHICANYIQHKDLKPPFMALVISGGHTNIVEVTDYNECHVLGGTRDDAAGEAYDKVARVLGLGYPGGPLIDKLAKGRESPRRRIRRRVFLEKGSLDFSFSGIKTGVLNYMNSERQAGRETESGRCGRQLPGGSPGRHSRQDSRCSRRHEQGQDRSWRAEWPPTVRLREMLQTGMQQTRHRTVLPVDPILCTDNAAMIGCAAYYRYKAGRRVSDLAIWMQCRICSFG